jgi:hypothetical protein
VLTKASGPPVEAACRLGYGSMDRETRVVVLALAQVPALTPGLGRGGDPVEGVGVDPAQLQ